MAEDYSAFLNNLYTGVLGRAPDAGGQAYWNNQLQNGGATRWDVLNSFTASPEFLGNQQKQFDLLATIPTNQGGTLNNGSGPVVQQTTPQAPQVRPLDPKTTSGQDLSQLFQPYQQQIQDLQSQFNTYKAQNPVNTSTQPLQQGATARTWNQDFNRGSRYFSPDMGGYQNQLTNQSKQANQGNTDLSQLF